MLAMAADYQKLPATPIYGVNAWFWKMRRKSRPDMTLSSEDEGSEGSVAAEQSRLGRQISGFTPTQAGQSESASERPQVRRFSDDASYSGPKRQLSGAPPAPSIRVRQPPPNVTVDPAIAALRARQAQPLPQEPKIPEKVVGWQRISVESEIALRKEPWYQFAELVAGVAGIPMVELVYFDPPSRKRQAIQWDVVPAAVLPLQAPANVPAPREGRVLEEEEEEEDLPSTPKRGQKSLRRGNPFGNQRAAMSQASPQEALQQLDADLQALLDVPAQITTENLQKLQQRRQAIKMLQEVRGATVQARLEVFLNPNLTSAERIARDLLRMRYPRTLGGVTVEALESSEDAASFFSLMVGSLYSRGQFSGGRRPLRATDYPRYGEGLSHGEKQFRFARYNPREPDIRRQITIDQQSVIRQQAYYEERAPWCVSSMSGTSAAMPQTSDSLRDTLASLPGFGPAVVSRVGQRIV